MQSYDEKVNVAFHVAFEALGLWVGNHLDLAFRLNDFISREFQFTVTGDDEDEPGGDAGGESDD